MGFVVLKADKHVRLTDVWWLTVLEWLVCIEDVKAQNPRLDDEALIELVMERLMYEKNLRRGGRRRTEN
ncbi:MAG: hypothetical protein NZ932_05170 [Candidatus Bathyarchaeota archaeon]|nr:hypothetical protein [Candidatus Bathyarchaeota archaeon]